MARRAQAAPAKAPKAASASKPADTNPRATAGGNGGDVSSEVFFAHLRDIEAGEYKKDQAVKDLRVFRKRAKDDGVDLTALDLVRRMNKFTASELAKRFNSVVTYAKYMNTPVYGQMGMFEEQTDKPVTEEEAFNMGSIAGKRGKPTDSNPWTLTTHMGQAWARGHREGNLSLAAGIKQKPEDPKQTTLDEAKPTAPTDPKPVTETAGADEETTLTA
jgi:hypothetical protein